MAPPHAFFALPLLLLGAASIQRVDSADTCAWAVDSCERSDEDSQCKVRLRRWCPCLKKPSWRCECKTRQKCGDESLMVNVSEARVMTKTTLRRTTKLETFCDLEKCFTFPRKCVNFRYYDRLYEDYFLKKCCYISSNAGRNDFLSSFCSQITKHKWCFFMLCGYHPKPKPKPKPTQNPVRSWTPWTENDLQGLDELEKAAENKNDIIDDLNKYWWLILVFGVVMPCLMSACFCSSKTNDQSTNSTTGAAKPPERPRPSAAPAATEPLMHPQPGEPVPLNRLPANLKAKLPDPPERPRVNINVPE